MFRHKIFLAAMLTFAVTACRYDELIDTTASMSAFDDSNLSERQIGLTVNELGMGVSTKATESEEPSEVEELAISYPFPIVFGSELEDIPIPMEGVTEGTVIPSDDTEIFVPVTRMYAKLKIKVELGDILYEHYDDIEIYYIDVGNIPYYCRVETLASEQGNYDADGAVSFPEGTEFTERAFSDKSEGEDDEYPYVLYVPENLGGISTNTNATPQLKTSTVPSGSNPLKVTLRISYKEKGSDEIRYLLHTAYPVGNNASGLNTGYYVHDYDDDHTGYHYGNDNKTILHKTAYGEHGPTYSGASQESSYVFYTHKAEKGEGVQYAISHPTVFLCGMNSIAQCLDDTYTNSKADDTSYSKALDNYIYRGAWSEENHDNQEWGATEVADALKSYDTGLITDASTSVVLYDNFGDKKSIFDPCPYGWRVAPGELWLGFFANGLNALNVPLDQNSGAGDSAGSLDNINYDPEKSCVLGMSLYLGSTWRSGLNVN